MPAIKTPGERLFDWIISRYKRQRVDEDSWIHSIAREFAIPSLDLEDFLMRSTTFMLVRRLIWNASWYEQRYEDEDKAIQEFEQLYLLGVLGFNQRDRKQLSTLVFDALRASKKDIPRSLIQRMKVDAQNLEQRCTISGCTIDYNAVNTESSFSLDHIWPQSLGGTSDESNLRVACQGCNSKRQNVVDASDTHYEHFHVKSNWSPDRGDNFWKQLNREFRIAALLRADLTCEMCKTPTPVEDMEGGLDFLRQNKDENYHMFNIKVACGKHRPTE